MLGCTSLLALALALVNNASLGLAEETQVANFDIPSAVATAHDCDAVCQRRLNLTIPADRDAVGLNFDLNFFATASNFSQTETKPGDVLKLQPVDPKTLQINGGATVYRFQYASSDYDNRTVPVTGFIAFPFTPHISPDTESSSKYRLAAFAHGTVGIFAGCAPSNGPLLYDYGTWQQALQRGYAIVATDYAGLGNNYTTHKYLHLPSHANDIYYSVVAARKLFGSSLTENWVSFGHSQGAGAVWKLAESTHVRNDASYLGTVAIAPATYLATQLLEGAAGLGSGVVAGIGFLPLIPTTVQRVITEYKPSILTPTMQNRVQMATDAQLCLEGILGLSIDLNTTQVIDVSGAVKDVPVLQQFQNMTAPAQGDRSPAPILVIQGQNDTAVSWKVTEKAWSASCATGNEVHLRLFPTQGHRPSLTAGAPEWLAWMDARFSAPVAKSCGRPACTKYTREPFNLAFVRAPTDVDLKPYLG